MKTKKKWLARVIFFIAVVFCVVILAACNDDSCSHSWGKWTVTTNATCAEAGVQERQCLKCGEKETSPITPLGHDWNEATCSEPKTCKNCSATNGSALGHTPADDDGDCTTDILCSSCGAVTTPGNATHTGGEATCTEKAKCEICGTEYGDFAEHTPEADDGDCTTDILCSSCGAVTTPGNATHTGGEATCTEKAKCEICGTEYGDFAEHTPEADDGDCTTDILCSSCGAVTTPGNATHTGGEATCINKAVCEICGTEYGDFAEHTPEADDGDCTTDILCSSCGTVTTPGNAAHTGGEATCINKAVCEICGTEYGDFAAHIPEADDGDCTTDIHCSICGAVTENTAHTGGEATCTNKAICEICGTEYGELAAHIPEADDGDCTTDILCSSCGAVTTPGNATHTGGEATCTEKAKCEICGTEYGELAAHIPEADDGDCTTDILCSSCGTVTTPGNATHTGGEATCINKAVCEICGTEYGDFAAHIPEADDGDCTTDIHCSICGAVTTPGNDENKGNSAITLPSVEAASGETQVSFAVSIRNNPGITGLTITVQYSSEFLTLTDAESGNALEALTFTEPSNLNSGCTFLWDAEKIEDEDIKNGEMLILTFNVSSSAPEGVYSIILNVSAFDNDLNPVSLIITGGKIVVKNN